ncbi:hypothetical protein K227x_17490 [Rubripirellula lacrimiformis]|uniref:Uncharacterized protein n=1 Tax=Rubripirellula lacrimiformis TaxID=1930273 RepID=A0A517N8A0_9BACT|nr:hypothetical protein [Rubripirellula lacrimiformis]QDT03367.1 hypothetical protein K227x_17490 [Rubripirellula lacrimiformis]
MSTTEPPEVLSDALRRLAGYLNFASGVSDAATRAAWNEVYQVATQGDPLSGMPAWLVVQDWVSQTLARMSDEQPAFRDTHQATRAVKLLWSDLLPAYLDFHRDLLFHQAPELLFNGFFMARAADAILSVGIDGDDAQVVQAAIDQLDDFVGYRPVAMLENRQCHPYRHEFTCPVPLYMAGAGVSAGPYQEVIQRALDALRQTDPSILRAASFDPDRLDELSLDPRAYDFDHPVNRRPNYHFGGWDERSIGNDGYYNRFVVRQVTLDALLHRLDDEQDLDRDELIVEAATVLAGTILMASGISGWGPGAYSSDITLGSLMKPIAAYRDAYYLDRLSRIRGKHGKRLVEEQHLRHQPFGAVRQHLNAALAQRRAAQLQHVGLARLYARMGYPDAAKRQTDTVSATSARMMCRIDCVMTLGLRRLRCGDLDEAVKVPGQAFDFIKRGIDCGALIDPWDILGFGANFSLYPGPESGVHDSRVDNLVYLTEQLFGYIARVWSEAAAQNNQVVYDEMECRYREIAEWWRTYAAHTVESIEAVDPLESYDSAKLVAQALRLWHQGGAAAGDVAFWAPHADLFDSPRAYSLVIQALLERQDFVPGMALLVHWLSNAEHVGLRSGGSSLPRLAERWLLKLRASTETKQEYGEPSIDQIDPGDTSDVWPLVRKFFDYLEANAEEYWSAPQFNLGKAKPRRRDWDLELTAMDDDPDGSTDDDDGLFDAAYEGVTYRDTTDDGVEGAIFEFGDESSGDELEYESKRLIEHLDFLQSLARMWAVAADVAVTDHNRDDFRNRWESLQGWAKRARENRIGLLELLDAVRGFGIAPAGSDKDSMRSYDRRRVLRDSLMERIIGTAVEMSDARRLISGVISAIADRTGECMPNEDEAMAEDDAQAVQMFAALIASDQVKARALFPGFLEAIRDKNLLYIPLSRGGDPVKIYVARLRQRVLRHLMHWLPRRGLISETCRLVETARQMEQQNPIGIGAVTEFDSLFQAGFRSLVASLVESTRHSVDGPQRLKSQSETEIADALIPLMERLTETLLASWLAHSQTLRLSPLETVADPRKWDMLVGFVKKYGDPMFTQTFLQLGNVRAILHQGVGEWLQRAVAEGEAHFSETQLFQDLENGVVQIKDVERPITLVYETLIDHHAEYLDYNSTTTQSDRGDLVYMFLDFLRLRVRYERIAWNLKPVMWAHEVLVRSGLDDAALLWRESLNERIGSEADVYVNKLRQLQQTYAMRMPTVADRINERFIQPMTIDRMRALIGPAMRDAESGVASHAFELLEQESELLTRHPTGAGLDVPAWLDSLEEEVEQLAKRKASSEIDPQSLMTIAIVPLTPEQLSDQLNTAKNQGRRLPHMK